MKYICPLLTVTDMKRAREFYEGILGQTVKFDLGENVTYNGDYAIHLRSHFSNLIDNREIKSGSNNFEIYFEHDEIDEFAKKLKENNVKFVHDVREQPWRQKVVRFYDPDENIIEVGESLEFLFCRLHKGGMDINEISRVVGVPIEYVSESLKKLLK